MYFFLYETADAKIKSNFLNWLCQNYSRTKYLGSKKSKSVNVLISVFKLNTSNTDLICWAKVTNLNLRPSCWTTTRCSIFG